MAETTYAPGAIKKKPESALVAVKTAPNVTAGTWFIFDPANGGYYGTDAEVEGWLDGI